jgi:hypothetical protein
MSEHHQSDPAPPSWYIVHQSWYHAGGPLAGADPNEDRWPLAVRCKRCGQICAWALEQAGPSQFETQLVVKWNSDTRLPIGATELGQYNGAGFGDLMIGLRTSTMPARVPAWCHECRENRTIAAAEVRTALRSGKAYMRAG